MTTFGVGHYLDYWIGSLHHYLTNNQLLIDLDLLEEAIRDIHLDKPDTTAATIFTKVKVCWKIWMIHFKISYPAFIELGNLLRTGSLFLEVTTNCKSLTKIKIYKFHIMYPIIANTAIKATIHFLQEDFENSPWVLSVFENNNIIKNVTLNLVNHRINPWSKVFCCNNIPTE